MYRLSLASRQAQAFVQYWTPSLSHHQLTIIAASASSPVKKRGSEAGDMDHLPESTSLTAGPSALVDAADTVRESDTSKTYPQIPLDRSKKQIRLLHLHPASFGGRLRGRLEVVSLELQPVYEALSYTWGARTMDKSILLNDGVLLPLTDNLYKCLRRLRHRRPWATRTLWIDAICVNQGDVQERGHQVAFVNDIYCSASRLCVWLGDVAGLTFLQWLQILIVPPLNSLDSDLRPRGGDKNLPRWVAWGSNKLGGRSAEAYCAALNLAVMDNQPQWHTRAWVYQELMSAQSRPVTWLFGRYNQTLSPGRLSSITFMSSFYRDALAGQWSGLYKMNGSTYDSSMCKNTLYDHCRRTKHMEASDPRDKVFNILGMISEEEVNLITVDYQATCAEVYAGATFASIAGTGSLEILDLQNPDHFSVSESVRDWILATDRQVSIADQASLAWALILPTWAADFSTGYALQPRPPANLTLSGCPPNEVRVSECLTRLHINVAQFDKVQSVSRTRGGYDRSSTFDMPSSLCAFLSDLMQLRTAQYSHTAYGKALRRRECLHDTISSPLAALQDHFSDVSRRPRLPPLDLLLEPKYSSLSRVFEWWEDHLALEEPFDASERQGNREPSVVDKWFDGVRRPECFFTTCGGFIGLSHRWIEPDDVVAMASGAAWPMLRPRDGAFQFQGFAFVGGIMDGELQGFWDEHGYETERITLV